MQAKAVQPGTWSYVPRADQGLPPEQQSRFLLSPLTFGERMDLLDNGEVKTAGKDGAIEIRPRNFRMALEIALAHVERVENFPAGAPVPLPDRGWNGNAQAAREAREAYFAMLGESAVYELAMEIWNRSSLGDLEKNSSSA